MGPDRPAQQEERPVEILQVEVGLGLQVVDLGLDPPVQRRRQESVRELQRLLELLEFLDQDLHPVQVGGVKPVISLDGPAELPQGLVVTAVVPEDLPAPVVGLGTPGVGPQGLLEPGEGLIDPSSGGGLHGLVQAVPVAVLIQHRSLPIPPEQSDSNKRRSSPPIASSDERPI